MLDATSREGFARAMPGRSAAFFHQFARLARSLNTRGLDFRRSARQRRELEIVEDSGLFDPNWYLSSYPDVAGAGLDPLLHFMSVGWREGRSPGPMFTTTRYLRANEDVAEAGSNPLLHFIEFGVDEGRAGFGERQVPLDLALPSDFSSSEASQCYSEPRTPFGEPIWLRAAQLDGARPDLIRADDVSLGYARSALRPELEAALRSFESLSRSAQRGSAGAALQDRAATRLIDAWFTSSSQLRTRWASTPEPFVVRAVQCDARRGGTACLVGEARVSDAPDVVDLQLINPYFPVLFVFSNDEGVITGCERLTFPSLRRGGPHYAELLWHARTADGVFDAATIDHALTERLRSLRAANARSSDAPDEAAKDPRVADSNLGLWLAEIFGVRGDDDASWAAGPDAMPTISSLLAARPPELRCADPRPASMLLVGANASEPALYLSTPKPGAEGSDRRPPAAICRSRGHRLGDAELLAPFAPDATRGATERPPITWIIDGAGWSEQALFETINSAALQHSSEGDHFHVIAHSPLLRPAPARGLRTTAIARFRSAGEAIAGVSTELAGFLNRGVLFHAPATVATLTSMLDDPAVASASCAIVASDRKGGVLKVRIVDGGAFVNAGGKPVSPAESARAAKELWRSRYPVSSPSPYLWLTRRATLHSWRTRKQADGLHMFSSEVTAVVRDGGTPANVPVAVPDARGTATHIEWLVG